MTEESVTLRMYMYMETDKKYLYSPWWVNTTALVVGVWQPHTHGLPAGCWRVPRLLPHP
jgi:hypothetical protein